MNYLLKFSAINLYFTRNESLLNKGENSYYSRNVLRIDFDPKTMVITGSVKASMKAKTYIVRIYLISEFFIQSANCECPRGQEICHHIGATMFAARYEVSKTDIPCTWVPLASQNEDVRTCRDVFNVTKPRRVTQRDLSQNEIDEFVKALSDELCCGFTWLLKDDENAEAESDVVVADVEGLLGMNEYLTSSEPDKWLKEHLALTQDEIEAVAKRTLGQTSNVEWFNARRYRITASNFGPLIGCLKRNRFPPSLFTRLMGQQKLDNIKAVQWGKTHKIDGIRDLEKDLKKTIKPTGVWLSKSGVLGASPDGLVDDCSVEVKCRFKSRSSSLKEDLSNDNSYVLWYNKSSKCWVINQDHDYFHQIQGQLYLTNTNTCYLVVWTPKECVKIEIKKEKSWEINLKNMENFYFEKFIPYIKLNL